MQQVLLGVGGIACGIPYVFGLFFIVTRGIDIWWRVLLLVSWGFGFPLLIGVVVALFWKLGK
jgi:hypothetical protein